MTWTWEDAFKHKTEEIRLYADQALANANMLADLRAHKADFTHRQIVSSAWRLRAAADRLDELAAKVAPVEQTLQAAE